MVHSLPPTEGVATLSLEKGPGQGNGECDPDVPVRDPQTEKGGELGLGSRPPHNPHGGEQLTDLKYSELHVLPEG